MKRIKLFEGFSEEYEINKVYEKWYENNTYIVKGLLSIINEADEATEPDAEDEKDWADETELNPAEERALARELQVISRPQLAALYLKALGQYEFGDIQRLKGRRTRAELVEEDVYVTKIPGIEFFANEDSRSGKMFIGPSALADAIGIQSLGTVTRTINKFRLLLDGEVGGREDEVLYPKVIQAFQYLRNKQVPYIQTIAARAMQDSETSNKHRSVLKTTGISKNDSLLIGKSIHSLFKDYYANKHFEKNVCKIQDIAIGKISTLKRIPVNELKKYYKEYLIEQKLFNKYNWCDLYAKQEYGVY
jgi:hypothetical protein